MIPENDRQATLLRARIERVQENLANMESWDPLRAGVSPIVIEVRKRNLRENIRRLKADVEAYDIVRSGSVTEFSASRIEDISEILKKARIARGLTHRQFGDLIGVREQQVQRYEADNYQGLSLHRLFDIASALRLNFTLEAKFDDRANDESLSGSIALPSRQLPLREMAKRGWIREQNQAENAVEYIQANLGDNAGHFLHRQVVRSNANLNGYSLLAWQARVCELARARRREVVKSDFFSRDFRWVRELVSLTVFDDGPIRAESFLKDLGVILVIEPHLEGTHLDGAATIIDGELPVVGLTLRHDRLDNFWFVLLHELGHLVLHAHVGDVVAFFDSEEDSGSAGREAEADEFARTSFIPDEKWKSSLVRFRTSAESIRAFAENNGLGVAVVAGRIRRERGDFAIFSDLVGRGKVRQQFGI